MKGYKQKNKIISLKKNMKFSVVLQKFSKQLINLNKLMKKKKNEV